MNRGTDELPSVCKLCIRRLEFLLCFIWAHFAVQLNLPIYRCRLANEDRAAARPNTITPLDSLQNCGSCLANQLRVTVDLGQKQNKTEPLTLVALWWLSRQTGEHLQPKVCLRVLNSGQWRTTPWHHGGSMLWEGSRGPTQISAVSSIHWKTRKRSQKYWIIKVIKQLTALTTAGMQSSGVSVGVAEPLQKDRSVSLFSCFWFT